MGDTTKIAWCDRTWNCWQGCTRVSEACAHCYMFRDKKRYGQDPTTVVRSSRATFRKPLSKRWREQPGRVFVCSWSDFCHEDADAWRADAWDIIRETREQTYLILTKRAERLSQCLPADWGNGYPNVWLGVTAENQRRADERIPLLLQTPAAVRFVSIEPMLEPIDLKLYRYADLVLGEPPGTRTEYVEDMIDWAIVGCESGPRARPTEWDWARSIRDQCRAAGIAFFLKQMMIDGRLVETPKLDGQRYTEFPG